MGFFKTHGALICTAVGCVGVAATGISAAYGTVKAMKAIDEVKKEKNVDTLTRPEIVKTAYKHYIPAVGLGIVSIVSIICAHKLSMAAQAELLGAYISATEAFRQFRLKVKATDEETYNKVIQCDIPEDIKSRWTDSCESATFYDEYSHKYFECTYEDLRDVEHELNFMFENDKYVTVYEMYRLLGFDEYDIPIDAGAHGWFWHENGSNYIRLDFEQHTLDDGMVINVLDLPFEPMYDSVDDSWH